MPHKDKAKQLAHQRSHYKRNPAPYKARALARRRAVAAKLAEYKSTLKCDRCPETHPACLDFHHLADDKEITIANAVVAKWSWPRILLEIQKCAVLCANCHRKLHYAEKMPGSFNGRTAVFEAAYVGSIPTPGANSEALGAGAKS